MKTRRISLLAVAALLMVAAAGLTSCTPGNRAVEAAKQQLGQPYRSGGESRAEGGFDCSGLTSYAWAQAGVSIPRTSSAQYSATRRISRSELRPGDLVFYSASGGRISHVAMYIGDGDIIHARKAGMPVRLDRVDSFWTGNRVGYGRVDTTK